MSRYARELAVALALIEGSGLLAKKHFYSDKFQVFTKADGSKVTTIDLAVNEYVVKTALDAGIRVRSEEAGSNAAYGEDKVFDLDPIDCTSDLIKGYARQPRRAQAAPSLSFWDKAPVIGAVVFPLLGIEPVTYWAGKGMGAYREQGGKKVRLRVDAAPRRGIVFVSSKTHTAAAIKVANSLRQMGYTPVPEHGAVFKACNVLDKDLVRLYPYHAANKLNLPVVGFMSQGVFLYDIAAASCLIQEAGGFATSPQNRGDKQPWVAANNHAVYNDLVRLAFAS